MDIQLKKELISINETVMRDNTQLLVQNDIIVPDIKSDMAKILQVDACACVEDIVCTNGAADISGKIHLNILYVPEGDSKPVCAMDTSVPFMTRIENSRIRQSDKCISSADVCHIEFSMINSRKLGVKIVVELATRCIRESTTELVCDIDSDTRIEKSNKNLDIYSLAYAGHTKIAISDTLDFPAGKSSAICALKIDASISDKQVRLITGKIVVKGNLNVCTLYVSTDNSVEFCEHEIPFTEVLDAEGATENCMCDVDLTICDTEFSLRPNTNGDMRLIDVKVIIEGNINVSQSTSMSALDDCFCRSHNLVCETKPFEIDTLAGIGTAQHSVRGTLSFDENSPELVSVYNLITKPYISSVSPENGHAAVNGVVDCYLLYLSSSSSAPVSSRKIQLPFEFMVDIANMDKECDCEVSINMLHHSYNITMSGEVEIRAAICSEVKAIRKNSPNLITNAYIGDSDEGSLRKGITIYFVQSGDTLWNIAKRYRVSPESIAQINNIENPDIINVGQRLLIM